MYSVHIQHCGNVTMYYIYILYYIVCLVYFRIHRHRYNTIGYSGLFRNTLAKLNDTAKDFKTCVVKTACVKPQTSG